MADDQQDRKTSFAKDLDGLAQKDNALDRARSLKEQFNRAANRQDHQQSRETEQARSGPQQDSQMVKEDAPALKPTPSGPMRQIPDRQAFAAKLAKEHDNADAKIEAARKAQEAFKSRQQQDKDRDQERDRDR
jgi:hypothetical protein